MGVRKRKGKIYDSVLWQKPLYKQRKSKRNPQYKDSTKIRLINKGGQAWDGQLKPPNCCGLQETIWETVFRSFSYWKALSKEE